jgi:hypothetical protein
MKKIKIIALVAVAAAALSAINIQAVVSRHVSAAPIPLKVSKTGDQGQSSSAVLAPKNERTSIALVNSSVTGCSKMGSAGCSTMQACSQCSVQMDCSSCPFSSCPLEDCQTAKMHSHDEARR